VATDDRGHRRQSTTHADAAVPMEFVVSSTHRTNDPMTVVPIANESTRRLSRCGVLPEAVAILLLALVMTVPGLFGSPLVRTEPHRVVPAHEMVETGRWLMPRFYGEPYLRKPPLHYWTLAVVERASGRTDDWIYRLPSALALGILASAACIFAAVWFGSSPRGGPRVARIAGLAAGVATLALVPLWGQSRTADVDALNTTFGVLAAWLAMEILRRGGVRAVGPVVALALAFAGATLTKGPATWPVLLGAIVATAWVLRPLRLRAAVALVTGLLGGGAICAAWMVTTFLSEENLDLSGVREVASKLDITDLRRLAMVVALPGLVTIFALPVVLATLHLRGLVESGVNGNAGPASMARAAALGYIAAIGIGVLVGLDNMRYLYPAVPLLVPVVGAVAAAWAAGALGAERQRSLRGILTGSAVGFGVAGAVLAVLAWRGASLHGSDIVVPVTALIAIVPATIATVRCWLRAALRPAFAGTVLVIAVASLAFGAWRAQSRAAMSSVVAAGVVRTTVGAEGPVLSGEWVMADPSVFHYSGVAVEYLPAGLSDSTAYRVGQWVVFEIGEWDRLEPSTRDRFDSVVELPVRARDALLARYRGGGQGPGPD